MSGVTKEQIARAKEIDLLTYLQNKEPESIKKSGVNEFKLVEHESLKISNGKWHWFSQGIGGKTALDFLIHVRGMEFVDAVRTLADERDICVKPYPKQAPKGDEVKQQQKKLELPQPHKDNFRVIAYLRNRGIDKEIIEHCIAARTLYESAKMHNCVFIGRDNKNKMRFACQRGTQGNFKQDLTGSDKRYGFSLPSSTASENLFVFESPIDALSHATLCKNNGKSDWGASHRISLGGTSPLALTEYLNEHPDIKSVFLCLDNDIAGKEAMIKIVDSIGESEKYTVMLTPPPVGKDYNDTLRNYEERKVGVKHEQYR